MNDTVRNIAAMDWRPIPGFPGYLASRCGHILGRRGWILTPKLTKQGYPSLGLRVDGKQRWKCVHQLVARAWLGPKPSALHQVAHFDGTRTNCAVENLRWATPRENNEDMDRHGTRSRGEAHPSSKLSEDDVLSIRRRLSSGELRSKIAAEYGVGYFAVEKIDTRKSWKHVP